MNTSLTPFDDAKTKFFELTLQGLKINGQPPISICRSYVKTIDQTEANIDKMKNACQLAKADLLVYVEKYHNDHLQEMLDILDLKMGSYRNMKSVAAAFPINEREPGITYGHMQALQKVKDKRKRREYINKIKSREISNVHHLRTKIKVAELDNEDYTPSLREILEAYSKPDLVNLILNTLDELEHDAAITVNGDGRGALMAFQLKLEENIRKS